MSDIIYTPPASGGGGTTINPTNNFIPKRSNATTFVDSVLENGSNYLYSNYGGFTGLGLDFLNFVSYLGDWNNLINGTTLVVNDATGNIYTKYNGTVIGLDLKFTNLEYKFGDSTNFVFISNSNTLSLNANGGQFAEIDGPNLVGFYGGTACAFRYNQTNFISSIGDYNGNNNSTFISNDDVNKEIVLHTNSGIITLNYLDIDFRGPTQVGNTGDPNEFLNIFVNGAPYVIKLYNP